MQLQSIYGDELDKVAYRLLTLAILDDEESTRLKKALNDLVPEKRTWAMCEQLSADTLKTSAEKTKEVENAIKAGMRTGESYKQYAWRLQRLERIYKLGGSPQELMFLALISVSQKKLESSSWPGSTRLFQDFSSRA